ncbi:adenylyl-sulfate kinase [Falsirhodobacter algicola]|uniref:Gluconokinase n=2 Tax=Falsirhodobacter algicola TaxID=2692330 RepID=A0A8J8MUI5_9RHOB|nr:adenylyl-sulfate kinase [Falsirhodobacter algicola]
MVLMGVSGCGKTTVGNALAAAIGLPYLDGDILHSDAAVAKMAKGIPLTDEDRWPWLRRVGAALAEQPRILGCSALKRAYRDLLRQEAGEILFIHLTGAPGVIAERMRRRSGHFMPEVLLQSQLADLQPPGPDEMAAPVDIDQPVEGIVRDIQLAMARAEASR